MPEARFYEKQDLGHLRCRLCPQQCSLAPGQAGVCRVRQNVDGLLYSLNYGQISSWGIDPIEKKPLYHFYPGSRIFSAGTWGCNFRCGFCQNWQIAQGKPSTRQVKPEELVRMALEARHSGSIGIAYTYSEPLVWFEFVYDCAMLAREQGLKNVLVTNGFIEPEPLREILPLIDALNIDIKGFTCEFYQKVCHGSLEPVKRTVEIAYRLCHVELTNLLVPTKNDSEEEIAAMVDWIAGLDREIPLHLSRYFPHYQFDLPPTPLESMQRAQQIAQQKLAYVYLGNAGELGDSDTFCPTCHNLLVRRLGYDATIKGLNGRCCAHCGAAINIVT
jgi:pyruvate formate lyase activating enzyme